ncbi:putative lipid II flippase FtsW [Microbacterium sp. ZXX196]|uniref:putative lipid II flippase FtsW n=1 Tax=Microbacterium sp. ZXX196 TaxID=2609291 RepID=UPI0012B70D7F|nr:putative lipid II flippase FtsW [Microbacterium sp. ZXX196]MTE24390.1 putative lipid II flippase FtsW [Microbacterium sp. ZXX196]
MTSTARPPRATDTPAMRARVSLGRAIGPLSVEFLLILSSVLFLTVFGVVMIFSATTVESIAETGSPFNDGMGHLVYAAVGIPLMLIVSRLPVAWLRRLAWPGLVIGLVLQLLVFTPLGFEFGGNRNWLDLGAVTVQPSEFLKLALALWMALVLYRKRDRLDSFWQVAIPLLPVALLAMGTVLAGEDLGTVMIMALIVLGAMFFAGVRLRMLLPLILGGVLAVGFMALTSTNRLTRIMSVLDQDCLDDYLGTCYQPLHAMWGLAGGGLLGLGLGNSKEKYNWLPAAADDYIFAIVGEELGLLGCVVVLALFAVLAVGTFRIVRRTDDLFARVAAGGIGVWIIGQALVNIGVVLRIFPALGVPLPFLSAGGSSLIAVLLASGILLSLARTLPDGARPVGAVPAPLRRKIVR